MAVEDKEKVKARLLEIMNEGSSFHKKLEKVRKFLESSGIRKINLPQRIGDERMEAKKAT